MGFDGTAALNAAIYLGLLRHRRSHRSSHWPSSTRGSGKVHPLKMRVSPADERIESTGAFMGFTGEPMSPTTDLTYLRARYYNPSLGRFLTQDAIVPDPMNGQAWNAYAYVYNDPLNLVDPSGFAPEWLNQIGSTIGGAVDSFNEWWDSGAEECECQGESPPAYTSPFFPVNLLNPFRSDNRASNYLSQLKWSFSTKPGRLVTEEIIYKRKKFITSFGVILTSWVEDSRKLIEIIPSWKNNQFVSAKDGSVIKIGGLEGRLIKTKYTKPRTELIKYGRIGALASTFGAGLIDGLFQAFSDWSNPCLTYGQRINRAILAAGIGLVGGAIGTLGFVGLTAISMPASAAVFATFGAGILLNEFVLTPWKNSIFASDPSRYGPIPCPPMASKKHLSLQPTH